MKHKSIANLLMLSLVLLAATPLWGQLRSASAHADPLIGTDAQGGNHPGATVPFGLIKLGADTRPHGAGYHYADASALGFSHLHQSGGSCAHRTDVVLMPYSSTKPLLAVNEYAATLKHASEQARAGYYAIALPSHKVKAEFTATTRVGMHRYTFDKPKQAALTIDLGQRGNPESTWIKLVNDNEIHGYIRSTAYGKPQMLYFVAQTSVAFEPMAVSDGGMPVALAEQRAEGRALSIALRFPTLESKPLLVKVAISLVDEPSAQNDLNAELPGWDFDKIAAAATAQWDKALERIEVKGGTTAQRTLFYTSLYRVLSSLSCIGSTDGLFVGPDGYKHRATVPSKPDSKDTRTFVPLGGLTAGSTHRALLPLLTIVAPERVHDVANSLLAHARYGGGMLNADSTLGYHAASVLADAWSKNVRSFNLDLAFELLQKTARGSGNGLSEMKRYKFVPDDLEPASVSKTLGYAYCDWCIAQMAYELKVLDAYDHFMFRAQAYKNLFDTSQRAIVPRMSNGTWAQRTERSVVPGLAPLCDFAVPHDVQGLMALHGGARAVVSHLHSRDSMRLYQHAEPAAHHIPYLYTLAGYGWETQRRVQSLRDSLYSPSPQGLCGSDVGAQLSAWYALSAMGLYPVCPGSPYYTITTPMFERVTIHLDGGRRFVIRANGLSAERPYIARTVLNGRTFDHPQLSHAELMAGGELQLDMLVRPNPQWGASAERLPSIPSADQIAIAPTMQAAGRTFSGELEVRFVSPQPNASIFYQVLAPTEDPNTTSGWLQGSSVVLKKSSIVRVYAYNGRTSSAIIEQRFDKTE